MCLKFVRVMIFLAISACYVTCLDRVVLEHSIIQG